MDIGMVIICRNLTRALVCPAILASSGKLLNVDVMIVLVAVVNGTYLKVQQNSHG